MAKTFLKKNVKLDLTSVMFAVWRTLQRGMAGGLQGSDTRRGQGADRTWEAVRIQEEHNM